MGTEPNSGHTGGYYKDAPLPVSRVYPMGDSTNFGHVWVSGDFDYYCLTGDLKYLKAAQSTIRKCCGQSAWGSLHDASHGRGVRRAE